MKYEFASCFADDMDQFLQMRAASLKETTITINRRQLKSFDSYLAGKNIHSITKEAVDGWIVGLYGSESTVSHAVCTVRIFIEYLANSGKNVYIPSVPKQHDTYIPYIFTEEESARILEFVDSYPPRWNNTVPYMRIMLPVIIRIALCCGMRLSEIAELRRKDFHSDTGVIIVENGKNRKARIIPLHESLTEILIKYCFAVGLSSDPETWLFPEKDSSTHIDGMKIYFRFACVLKKAGITVPKGKYERGPCFHCLRHTFVLRAFKQLEDMGIDTDSAIPYLSIYLGHNNLKETERYMKFTNDMFWNEFQKFASFTENVFPEVQYED